MLGVKVPVLSDIPIVSTLFWKYNMDAVVYKPLLAGDTFMPEMHLRLIDHTWNKSAIKNEIISNKELAEELHKPVIRKFDKRKIHSLFIDNIWGWDLAGMQLISKSNRGIIFLLCVIDNYSKYAWVIPLKDKKGYYN